MSIAAGRDLARHLLVTVYQSLPQPLFRDVSFPGPPIGAGPVATTVVALPNSGTSTMKLRFDSFAVVAIVGISARCFAQIPFEPPQPPPAQAAPTPAQTPQSQADVEWLTSYMLVHEGYRFDDLPALERSLEKMSPTQLRTLRQFIEEKHAMDIERAATVRQMPAEQLTSSALDKQRQQQALDQYNEDQSQGPDIADVRLEHMKNLAEANERGELIQIRTPELPGNDPFGPTPKHPFGFGSHGTD